MTDYYLTLDFGNVVVIVSKLFVEVLIVKLELALDYLNLELGAAVSEVIVVAL